MDQKTIITSDNTCDLPRELCERYHIHTVGLLVTYDNKTVVDDGVLSTAEMFDYTRRSGQLPQSSARSIADYADFFRSFTDQGYQVVHISLSSELSSTYQNATLAAEELPEVYTVDSRLLSSGQAILAIKCAEKAAEGWSAKDIQAFADEAKRKISTTFILDTLDFLVKGGRCSALAAFGANLLKIKPSILMPDGKLVVGKKYRGKWEACVEQYVRDQLSSDLDYDLSRVFLTYTTMDDLSFLDRLKEIVLSVAPFEEVIVNTAGVCIGAHCGPNCFGILFATK